MATRRKAAQSTGASSALTSKTETTANANNAKRHSRRRRKPAAVKAANCDGQSFDSVDGVGKENLDAKSFMADKFSFVDEKDATYPRSGSLSTSPARSKRANSATEPIENHGDSSKHTSGRIKIKRRSENCENGVDDEKRKRQIHTEKNAPNKAATAEATKKPSNRVSKKEKAISRKRNIMALFKVSLEQDNKTISKPIQSSTLLQTINRASNAFPNSPPGGEGMIVLEEKTLDIINIARHCIRSAISAAADGKGSAGSVAGVGANNNENYEVMETKLAYLRTAIYCLRSVVAIIVPSCSDSSSPSGTSVSNERVTMAMKLLYHCITTVGEIQNLLFNTIQKNSDENGGIWKLFFDASFICVYGYEMLGLILNNALNGYVTSISSMAGDESSLIGLFPVPCDDFMASASFLEQSDMSISQIIKIAAQSSLSLGSILNSMVKLFAMKSRGDIVIKDDDLDQMSMKLGVTSQNCTENLNSCYVGVYRNLLSQITIPWSLIPLTIGDLHDTNQVKLSLSFVMKGSKLLLDTASYLEKSIENIPENEVDYFRRQIILLQQDSIFLSLLYQKSADGAWVTSVDVSKSSDDILRQSLCKNLKKACISAIRIAAAYATSVPHGLDLALFHRNVGVAIDNVARALELLDVHHVEYSTYRALQLPNDEILLLKKRHSCGSPNLSSFPFLFLHPSQGYNDEDPLLCILSVFFLGLAAKRSLLFDEGCVDDMELIDNLVEAFRKKILLGGGEINSTLLSLAHRSLSKLKLQLLAMEQTKSTNKCKTFRERRMAYVTGKIVGECLGPLNVIMMKMNQSEKNKYYGLALDCYVRAASLFDCLGHQDDVRPNSGNPTFENQCFEKSEKLVERCRQFSSCCPNKSCYPIISHVAKALSNIAKRRITTGRKTEAFHPFFASLEIFIAVEDKELASRFLQISSVLQSEDMTNEAFGTLCYSIVHCVQEINFQSAEPPTLDQLVLFCDDYINGTLPSEHFVQRNFLPRELRALLNRAARLLVAIISRSERGPELPNILLVQSPPCLAIKIQPFSQYNNNDMVRSILRFAILSDGSAYIAGSQRFRVSVVLEFLQEFGGMLVELIKRGKVNIIQKHLVGYITTYIEEVKAIFGENEDSEEESMAPLYMVGAAIIRALSRNEPVLEDCSLEEEALLICLAENELNERLRNNACDYNAARLLIQYTSIFVLRSGIDWEGTIALEANKNNPNPGDIVAVCSKIILLLKNSLEQWKAEDLRIYSNALSLNLYKILQRFEFNGFSGEAAKCISLLKDFSLIGGFPLQSVVTPTLCYGERYACATAAQVRTNSDIYDPQDPYLLDKIEPVFHRVQEHALVETRCAQNSIMGEDFTIEIFTMSATLQIAVMTEDLKKIPMLTSQISSALGDWERFQVDLSTAKELSLPLSISVSWWISSCHMALYFGNARLGNYISAWHNIRQCLNTCRTALEHISDFNNKMKNTTRSISSDRFLAWYLTCRGYKDSNTSRFYMSLELISKVYAQLGDAKKAKSYIIATAESLQLIPARQMNSKTLTLHEITCIMNERCNNIRHLQTRTTTTNIFSLSSPRSKVTEELSNILVSLARQHSTYHSPFLPVGSTDLNFSHQDWLREVINYLILFQAGPKDLLEEYEENLNVDLFSLTVNYVKALLETMYSDRSSLDKSEELYADNSCQYFIHALKTHKSSFSCTLCKSGLLYVKKMMHSSNFRDCIEILENIAENQFATSDCRAESLFILGMENLKIGRESGELFSIWSGCSSLDDAVHEFPQPHILTPNLDKAKELLFKAATFAGPASSLLSRKILRSLALAIGPDGSQKSDISEKSEISAGELVHSSIGSSARQTVSRTVKKGNDCHDTEAIFQAYDCPLTPFSTRRKALLHMYQLGIEVIPQKWDFVAIAVCPTGEVLISRLKIRHEPNNFKRFCYKTVCIFPDEANSYHETTTFAEKVLQPFHDIMEDSKRQLSGIDTTIADEKFNSSKESKQAWWDKRHALDEELQQLLQNIDMQYFKPSCVQGLISSRFDEHEEEIIVKGKNLSARFEAACTIDQIRTREENDPVPGKNELKKLTVVKLKERLKDMGVINKEFRSLRKAELVDLIHSKLLNVKSPLERSRKSGLEHQTHLNNGPSHLAANCTFLILDEHTNKLPLEALQSFRGKTICRTPSLSFTIASLRRACTTGVGRTAEINPSNTTFVVDPESNLAATQQRISSTLSKISKQNDWEWVGTVGKLPTKAFMQRALKQKQSLYLYFGHGAGERFFSQSDIEDLPNAGENEEERLTQHDESGTQQCHASIVLMGCSSGDIVSVNTERGSDAAKNQMHFEPQGAALSYLCAGAPCVVGNLWDVTDRDIDRFSISLLEGMFHSSQLTNIATCVESSRHACKLKVLVGAAPVVYGIPVLVRRLTKQVS